MSIKLNSENTKIIALAIIEQSVLDYYNILTKKIKAKHNPCCNKIELEKFFQSGYFVDLSDGNIDGIAVMKSLQEKAEKNIPLEMPRRCGKRTQERKRKDGRTYRVNAI